MLAKSLGNESSVQDAKDGSDEEGISSESEEDISNELEVPPLQEFTEVDALHCMCERRLKSREGWRWEKLLNDIAYFCESDATSGMLTAKYLVPSTRLAAGVTRNSPRERPSPRASSAQSQDKLAREADQEPQHSTSDRPGSPTSRQRNGETSDPEKSVEESLHDIFVFYSLASGVGAGGHQRPDLMGATAFETLLFDCGLLRQRGKHLSAQAQQRVSASQGSRWKLEAWEAQSCCTAATREGSRAKRHGKNMSFKQFLAAMMNVAVKLESLRRVTTRADPISQHWEKEKALSELLIKFVIPRASRRMIVAVPPEAWNAARAPSLQRMMCKLFREYAGRFARPGSQRAKMAMEDAAKNSKHSKVGIDWSDFWGMACDLCVPNLLYHRSIALAFVDAARSRGYALGWDHETHDVCLHGPSDLANAFCRLALEFPACRRTFELPKRTDISDFSPAQLVLYFIRRTAVQMTQQINCRGTTSQYLLSRCHRDARSTRALRQRRAQKIINEALLDNLAEEKVFNNR
jgi:hypothetical protein